jgi:murein hydrolase activator
LIVRWSLAGLAAFTAVLLLCGGSAVLAQDRKDLDALRSRIERLRTSLASAEENRSEAREELRESELAISESGRRLRVLAEQGEAMRKELQTLESRQGAVQSGLASREQQLGQLLAAIYRTGDVGYVQLLLSGNEPSQTARDLHYLAHLSKAHASLIDTTRAELNLLKELESGSRMKSAQIRELEQAHRAQHAELLKQQAARRRVLERISARIKAQQREVDGLARDESRLSRLVQELSRVIAAVAPRGARNELVPQALGGGSFTTLKGRLRLPSRGVVANRFGSPRIAGGPSWKGVFIRTSAGEEVRAVAAGRVVFSEWMRGVGNLLVIDHGQGYLTIYGNNQSVYKTVGDEVRAGDIVAAAGASGGTEETGLYFEMRHEGRAFDPMSWVTLR